MEKQGIVHATRTSIKDGEKSAYLDLAIQAKKGKFKGQKIIEIHAYDGFAPQVEALKTGQEILAVYKSIKGKNGEYLKLEALYQ